MIEHTAKRNRTFLAQWKLRRDDQGNAGLVQRMRKARARNSHRTDIAAVAARHGHDRGTTNRLAADPCQRARETLAGDDIRCAVVVAEHQAVRVLRCLVAVRQHVDVRIPRVTTFAHHVRKRRIPQDRQQIAELLACAVIRQQRIVTAGISKRLDRVDNRLAVVIKGHVVRIA